MSHLSTRRASRWLWVFGIAVVFGLMTLGIQTGSAVAHGDPELNQSPNCSNAAPSKAVINKDPKNFESINVLGITDPDDDAFSIVIFAIRQDELVGELKPGKKEKNQRAPDGKGIGTDTAELRAERDNKGNGRVYHISVRATDEHGAICSAFLQVSVPKNNNNPAVDDGALFDSTTPTVPE